MNRRLQAVLALAYLATLWTTAGCTRAGTSILQAKEIAMPAANMKKISIGRADLMVPEDATVTMSGQVNEVMLHIDRLKPGETFEGVWAARTKKIASGAGEDPNPGQTAIRKTYPASNGKGQVYYEQGKDPRILVVMERWQMIGSVLVKAREEFEPKYLPDVERDIEAVFSNMALRAPSNGDDFAVGPVTVHLLTEGAESTEAGIQFALPTSPGEQPVQMNLSFKSRVLSTPGSITILNRVKQATEGSAAAGVQVTTLRAHKRAIGALAGEESVLSFSSKEEGKSGIRAEWGTPGVANDAHAPQTELFYTVGKGDRANVPLALADWDGILSSLRYRR